MCTLAETGHTITGQSREKSSRPSAGDPESTNDQANQDGEVGELDDRGLAPLYFSADRLRLALLCISNQSFDIAGGVCTSAGMILTSVLATKASGKTVVRILMVGLQVSGKTTILFKLKLGEMVTTVAKIGSNVETLVSPCGPSGGRTSSALCGIIASRKRTV